MKFPIVDPVRTGQNIRTLRKNAGISIKDLQNMLGLGTPQAIYKWQRGDTLPTIDNLVVLSSVFGVKIDDILAVG